MNVWRKEWKPLLWIILGFLICFTLPVEILQNSEVLRRSVFEALYLVRWYAQEHVLLCLIPAFFIAGAIAVFISHDSVMKYLGPSANMLLAYGVASVSGTILAVCSCTVLPLFAGIYRMGAGLGPATAFLYSGPAINVLAIIMTARILGVQLGIARAVGAVLFSIVIGLLMAFIFRKEELDKIEAADAFGEPEVGRPLWQNAVFFGVMVGILVFSNWANPGDLSAFWAVIYGLKWWITSLLSIALAVILVAWLKLPAGKVILVAAVTAVLALRDPETPLLAFSAGILGLSWLTSTSRGKPGSGLPPPGTSPSRSCPCCCWAFWWPEPCWAGQAMRP